MRIANRCAVALFILLAGCSTQQKKNEPATAFPDSITPVTIPAALPQEVRIAAVGDIMLGGTGITQLQTHGYDYPFAATQSLFARADVVIGNLETSLTVREGKSVDKKYRFRNPPDKVAPALKKAGFNLVTLANNHSMDYGREGLEDTLLALSTHGIHAHGAGMNVQDARKPVVFLLDNGWSIGFLAYSMTLPPEFWATADTPGTAFGHERWVREDVRKLNELVDLVVVSFHWGVEKSTILRDYQPALAHAAIDEGADLVIGHHPHILQALELYQGKPILYSLGNYVFGTYSTAVSTGGLANIIFRDGAFDSLELTPININNFKVEMQPQLLVEVEGRRVFDQLATLSAEQNTVLQWQDGKIVLKPVPNLQ